MMKFSADELRRLVGAEFNLVLKNDPELTRLEGLKHDRAAEARLLLEVMGLGDYRIGKLPVRPLTAAKWALLWLLRSPFVVGGGVGPADLDLALYVLSRYSLRELPGSLHELPGLASGLRLGTGLPDAELPAEIGRFVDTARRPMELLPDDGATEDEPRYDAQWLTRMAGVAARETGRPLDWVMHRMSLGAVCCCYVSARQRESAEPWRYERRADPELAVRISARIDELAADWLRQRAAARGC